MANSEKPIALGRDIGHKGFVETEKEADENPKNWRPTVHLDRPAYNLILMEQSMTKKEFFEKVYELLVEANILVARNANEFFAELIDINEHYNNEKTPQECAWYIIHNREETDQGEAEFG